MKTAVRDVRMHALCGVEGILVAAATTAAFFVRFPASEVAENLARFYWVVPLSVATRMASFWFLGLYNWVWYYFGMREVLRLAVAIVLSSALLIAIVLPLSGYSFPETLLVVDWLLVAAVVVGERFSIRLVREGRVKLLGDHEDEKDKKRVLVVGAGDAAETIIREMYGSGNGGSNGSSSLLAVGCVDDDLRKMGRRVHQVPVLGTTEDIPRIVQEHNVKEVIIAVPSASGEVMQRVVRRCEDSGARFRTLPTLGELIDGKVSINRIREVEIEDLLGREENHLDLDQACAYLQGESVLVTGAGGSIGSELCRQIAALKPGLLIMFDWSENSIYEVDLEMRRRFPALGVEGIVGSIRDVAKVKQVMERYHPGAVFHAAAHKHVPMMEVNPDEAVLNNILGTRVLADAAEEYGVGRFVSVSTDKAVRPASIMGATKQVVERMLLTRGSTGKTRFMIVRFGNVLGSNASVIPLFKKQIAQGGPVTVTHPQMTRYFMTISEAAQLIIRASGIGHGGEIFILEMGRPVNITDLARRMIKLSGLGGKGIEIKFIGVRRGEKLHEKLVGPDEELLTTPDKKISIAKPWRVDTDGWGKGVDELIDLAANRDNRGLRSKLMELVPTFQPSEELQSG